VNFQKDGSSFLDNADVNQAVILGESNNNDDDVDLKNTSFFAQDFKNELMTSNDLFPAGQLKDFEGLHED